MEFTLLGAAGFALAGAWLALRAAPADERRERADLLLGSALIGLAVGRLAAMILGGTNPLTSPGLIPLVRGGVDTGWAATAALGWLAWRTRRDLGQVDLVAVPAVAALAGWEAGCLVRASCTGTPTALPWSIDGRHPVGLYAALGLAGIAWMTSRVPRRARGGLALAGTAAVRLAVEPWRIRLGDGPVSWYLAGIVAGVLLITLTRRRRLAEANPHTGSSVATPQRPDPPTPT